MRVGLELTGLELDATGSARYIRALREELDASAHVDVVPLAHGHPASNRRRGRVARGLAREFAYFPFRLPREAAAASLSLLHCPSPLAPSRCPVPLVITVQDTLAWDRPEWLTRSNRWQLRLRLPRALRRAEAVLAPSEFTRQRLLELFDLEPTRVQVTPLGVDRRFSVGPVSSDRLDRLGIRQPYILTVGSLQPRKNQGAVIDAFDRLSSAGLEHTLVVAGPRGWSDDALHARLRSLGTRVRITGRISDEDLAEIYRGADCLVFPSLYEGFGLPAVEAMACGTPVVASDKTSLPELVGDAGVLVDAQDSYAIAAALSNLLESPERRQQLSQRGIQRASRFTWASCAQRTLAAYRHAIAA